MDIPVWRSTWVTVWWPWITIRWAWWPVHRWRTIPHTPVNGADTHPVRDTEPRSQLHHPSLVSCHAYFNDMNEPRKPKTNYDTLKYSSPTNSEANLIQCQISEKVHLCRPYVFFYFISNNLYLCVLFDLSMKNGCSPAYSLLLPELPPRSEHRSHVCDNSSSLDDTISKERKENTKFPSSLLYTLM